METPAELSPCYVLAPFFPVAGGRGGRSASRSEPLAVGAHGVDDGVGEALAEIGRIETRLAVGARDERGLEQDRGHERAGEHVEAGAFDAAVRDLLFRSRATASSWPRAGAAPRMERRRRRAQPRQAQHRSRARRQRPRRRRSRAQPAASPSLRGFRRARRFQDRRRRRLSAGVAMDRHEQIRRVNALARAVCALLERHVVDSPSRVSSVVTRRALPSQERRSAVPPMSSVTSFSRSPLGPIAPGSFPPCPGSSTTRCTRRPPGCGAGKSGPFPCGGNVYHQPKRLRNVEHAALGGRRQLENDPHRVRVLAQPDALDQPADVVAVLGIERGALHVDVKTATLPLVLQLADLEQRRTRRVHDDTRGFLATVLLDARDARRTRSSASRRAVAPRPRRRAASRRWCPAQARKRRPPPPPKARAAERYTDSESSARSRRAPHSTGSSRASSFSSARIGGVPDRA